MKRFKNEYFKQMYYDIAASIIAGFLISFLYFIFSDYVFVMPNLNGKWMLEVEVEDASLKRYKGMKLYYEVMLIQKGYEISGTGEKYMEVLGNDTTKYLFKNRVQVQIDGYLDENYLSKDKLTIHALEAGRIRNTSTFFNLIKFDENLMTGDYQSTAAKQTGTATWTRAIDYQK